MSCVRHETSSRRFVFSNLNRLSVTQWYVMATESQIEINRLEHIVFYWKLHENISSIYSYCGLSNIQLNSGTLSMYRYLC
jgi:hypothetical protein